MSEFQTVFIVDDDPGMRKSLHVLLASEEIQSETFESARAFIDSYDPKKSGCLVLDMKMPGMSGLELQEHLVAHKIEIPIIIISAHADVPSAVKSMKLGSFDFIEKPYSAEQLIERIRSALTMDRDRRAEAQWRGKFRDKIGHLTSRERDIVNLVVTGRTSKMIANELNLSVSTVDNHRANIMKKLGAETIAELTRMAFFAEPTLANIPKDDGRNVK